MKLLQVGLIGDYHADVPAHRAIPSAPAPHPLILAYVAAILQRNGG